MKTYKKTFTVLLIFLLGYCYQQATAQTAKSTSTTIASSLNPSTVGASVTFTATVKDNSFFSFQIVNEGTVTFSEGATVLAANEPVSAGLASFSTTALTTGSHVITAVYNGTASYATSSGLIVQTVDDPGSCLTYAGNIAYVNVSATPGTNNGTTWANAFLTLQGALDAARTCGVTQIWVAQGTYVPTNYPIGAATGQFGGVLTSADFSFHMVNGVAIYGGFSGNGTETILSQRNWRQNPTILSGSNARYHVVTSANDGLATQLDGFTITGGYANGNTQLMVEGQPFGATTGAGVNLQNSSVTLSNLIISGNSCPSTDFSGGSGGGMAMQGGSSVFTNVAFVENSAYSGGGLTASSTFTMTNCVFSGNTANAGGGGMFTGSRQDASATLTNVVFANNAATRSSPSASSGGAMINNSAVTTLVNCTFFGNTAPGTGGTMYSVNGATVSDKNGIYYNNSNNGNTAYNGVFNYTSSGPFMDQFNPTTTLSGTDPKFVNAADPDGPDNRWMTADDGLSIQSSSPAINAGTAAGAPATDIRGFARTGNPDQGAYEYGVFGSTSSILSVTGSSTICNGSSTNLAVAITGGTSPYTVVYSDGTNSYTVNGYISGTAVPVSPTTTTTYSLVSVTDAASLAGTGNSGTATVTVTNIPKLRVVIGSADITANNDGADDKGAFAVCNTANNIGASSFTDANGSTDSHIKFQQTYVPVNVSANLCTACATTLPFSRGAFTASLINPAQPGTITLRWRAFVDANSNNIVDASECTGDWVELVITVNPTPNAVATPSLQTICSGTAITTIALTGDVAGTTFNWTRDKTATVTGIGASGSGDIIGSLTNTTTAPVMVTFTITPATATCQGSPITATVMVNPLPTVTCPGNIVANNTPDLCSAVVTYSSSATGTPAPDISFNFSGATTGSGSGNGSRSTFNLGVTTVTITATNTCGTIACSFTVTVKDVQPPVINLIANPTATLWSPDHNYVAFTAAQFISSVSDNCGGIPVGNVVITKATSDEADDAPGGGDGNTNNDIVIASGCKSVQLRSERMGGGNGRVYNVYVAVQDNSGNTGTAMFKVIVPPNQSGVTAVDDITPLYTVNSSCNQSAPIVSAAVATKLGVFLAEPNGQPSIQNYPNPFSSATTIRYNLPVEAQVTLSVYNQLGQKLAVLVNARQTAGSHQVNFNAEKAGAGIYQYQLQTTDVQGKLISLSGKMVMMK